MPNWHSWCHQAGLAADANGVLIRFAAHDSGADQPSRGHRVAVKQDTDHIELCGVVLRDVDWQSIPPDRQLDLLRHIGAFNRSSIGVGCRFAPGLGLVAEAHLPKAGLGSGEFVQIVRHVAAHADRLEFWLTAEDRE